MLDEPARHAARSGLLTPLVRAGRSLAGPAMPRRPRATEPASIDWQDDYAGALSRPAPANRLLWIQFTGPWCPNCTRMERDSFPQPAIVEHSQRSFVAVKLRSDLNEQLVAAFNLTAIPATVVVAPNRDIVAFHQGYLGPEQLDGLLRDCLARVPLEPAATTPSGSGEARERCGVRRKTSTRLRNRGRRCRVIAR